MTTPTFPPAVLAALARWDEERRENKRGTRAYGWYRAQDALTALTEALDAAHASRDAAMHAAESEALDEARRASPFRFTAKPRTEPML